jgi:hypothetical protein
LIFVARNVNSRYGFARKREIAFRATQNKKRAIPPAPEKPVQVRDERVVRGATRIRLTKQKSPPVMQTGIKASLTPVGQREK